MGEPHRTRVTDPTSVLTYFALGNPKRHCNFSMQLQFLLMELQRVQGTYSCRSRGEAKHYN